MENNVKNDITKSANNYDVIVVGGGHAGCEAALAAAKLGCKTMLATLNLDHIAQMPCNPAIGGIAKGQLVREIDALGGAMGENTDATTIQFRMLNHTKGAAVWSPRAQCDKNIYQLRMKSILENQQNLHIRQMEICNFIYQNGEVCGVINQHDENIFSKSVVVCTGTFLRGLLHYGDKKFSGGRAGDKAADLLSDALKNIGIKLGRLKTGTPARILADSIDFSKLEYQKSIEKGTFSYFPESKLNIGFLSENAIAQRPCYIGRTTAETRNVVQKNLHLAPMYSGIFEGIGARYCPSFEDKVVRFAHHETHQLFIEPEGVHTDEYYVNGISTSLPPHVQWEMIRTIPGFENAVMTRYAYAVEYDFAFPSQLNATLEVKDVPNLFLAGQINGTSGYEEAAGQGLVAGVNAALNVLGKPSLIIGRSQGYLGVMIDDLITKEIIEPYRLFTSRSEYRLSLRQDNADLRLTPLGREIGLISDARWNNFQKHCADILEEKIRLQSVRNGGKSQWEWLKQHSDYLQLESKNPEISPRICEHLEIEAKYDGYIKREKELIISMEKLEIITIPAQFDYASIKGLKNEAREKLQKFRPENLSQASRIDGLTPAEISLLQIYLRRK